MCVHTISNSNSTNLYNGIESWLFQVTVMAPAISRFPPGGSLFETDLEALQLEVMA